ncbi:VOC family protein [Paraburkholderia sacchari]|uniref:VOC family protein n=1 Tax=Paraburkholderia sacchari TaxID=159450 RepID=UPI0039A50D2E
MSQIFGDIRQVAMVVHDVNAAMRQWAQVGVGPFGVLGNFRPQNYVYRGQPMTGPLLTLCFAQSGDVQIELIQQHDDTPSAYIDFLGSGKEGCQHVCAWYANHADYDAKRTALLERGFTIVHEGESAAPRSRFAYFETRLPGGLMFEISEATLPEFMPLWQLLEERTRNWDGRELILKLPTA